MVAADSYSGAMATPAVRGHSLFFRSLEPPDGWDGGRAAVAGKGYAATTIADIVREASVSRRTFYEHFQAKSECLIAL